MDLFLPISLAAVSVAGIGVGLTSASWWWERKVTGLRRDLEGADRLNVELSTVNRNLSAERDAWKREHTALDTTLTRIMAEHDRTCARIEGQRDEANARRQMAEQHADRLSARLAEAFKNDARDPKTGRFVKSALLAGNVVQL